jgi:hypothetical protein
VSSLERRPLALEWRTQPIHKTIVAVGSNL